MEINFKKIKKFIFKNSGITGAILTSYAYFIAYAFEYGTCEGFEIPTTFISVGLIQIIVVFTSLVSFIAITALFYWIFVILFAGKFAFVKQLKDHWIAFLTLFYIWLILIFLFDKKSDIRFLYKFFLFGAGGAMVYQYLSYAWKKLKSGANPSIQVQPTNNDSVPRIETEPASESDSSLNPLSKYLGLSFVLTMIFLVIIPVACRQLGYQNARNLQTYSVQISNTNFAIIKKEDDLVFARSYKNLYFTDTLKSFKSDGLNEKSLKYISLSFPPDTTTSDAEHTFDQIITLVKKPFQRDTQVSHINTVKRK